VLFTSKWPTIATYSNFSRFPLPAHHQTGHQAIAEMADLDQVVITQLSGPSMRVVGWRVDRRYRTSTFGVIARPLSGVIARRFWDIAPQYFY
jgi:hypothetical protein